MRISKSLLISTFAFAFVCLATAPTWAEKAPVKAPVKAPNATKYKVAEGTKLRIDVYHPAKHVIAKTSKVKGSVTATGALGNGTTALSGKLKVKIKSLKSGNKRRDSYMWKALGKKIQKRIIFRPKSITLKGGKGTLKGTFKIRKKTKEVTFQVIKHSLDAKTKTWTVDVKGHLLCTDFDVERPSLLFVKIKDKVDVQLTIQFKPAS